MKTKNNEQANPPKMPKLDWSALKKVFGYLKHYKWGLALVVVCILLNAVAGAASSLFLQTLIDKYILPMVGLENPEFAGLIRALITIGTVYLVGVATIWIYSQVMVTIAQGTLKRIRDDMITKMQKTSNWLF